MSNDYQDRQPSPAGGPSTSSSEGKVGAPIFRKAGSGGGGNDGVAAATGAADAHAGLDRSSGKPMADGVREKMERAFGADFSDVRIHEGPEAASLGAVAFARGSDISFQPGRYDPEHADGQHLLGHELAHVVQQRSGGGSAVQAKAAVSSVGDASEHAADAAADAVVRGDKVGSVGTASATIQRDAMDDLKDAASGNWLGSVDSSAVLAKAAALPAPDKASLAADSGGKYDDLKRRIFKKLNGTNSLAFMQTIGMADVRWQLYWLNMGNSLDELTAQQWQVLMGFVSPPKMDELRKYPNGYKAFIRNAPVEAIPPWDRLQGLVDGTWKGQPVDVRNAVVNLNADQKAKVRADNAKMAAIMSHTGDVNEQFRCVTYLDFKVKFAVFWLDNAKTLPALNQTQWSQMLAEATRADYDELVGWGAMWALVQKYCPASVLQVTRQNSDPATATKAFDDPVQLDTMFKTLGAAGFLATAVKDPTTVDDVYKKLKAGGKVTPTVQGLPTGAQMGAAAKANLKQWMYTPGADDADCQVMFEQRFRVQTHGLGTYDHLHSWDDKKKAMTRNNVDLQPFTKEGLRQMWGVCETLPPAAVENNPKLLNILRDQKNGPGNAYYAGPGVGKAQGDILMGYGGGADATKAGGTANDDLATNVGSNVDYVYQADGGGTSPGTAAVNMPMFNATLRHEIGHAVDAQLNVMAGVMDQAQTGGWKKYGSWTEWIDAMIAAGGGMNYGSKAINAQYRQGMIDAVSGKPQHFSDALTAKGITPPATDPGGPVSAVWTTDRWTGQPWYDQSWKRQGNLNFQCAYGGEGTLFSFRADVRDKTKVTAYQWRAPGEWFAEVYQVYYSETEAGPNTPVGGRLRSHDPAAADMVSAICDRGFSPQDMTGGKTNKAPGT